LTTKDLLVSAAKGEDLHDLLDHIAWTDTIQPELMKLRESLTRLLVGAVLNGKVVTTSGAELNKEQSAGQIDGLDFINDLFTRLLRKGANASEELRKLGISA
jgi:hypothetical protein